MNYTPVERSAEGSFEFYRSHTNLTGGIRAKLIKILIIKINLII